MKEPAGIDWNAARARLEQIRRQLERTTVPAAGQERVLRQRAAILARPAYPVGNVVPEDAVVIFRLGEERYAMLLSRLSEVVTDVPLAPVPGAPPQVAGVIQMRGEIRPVFELGILLGLTGNIIFDTNTVILFRHSGRDIGFRVTRVEDIRAIALPDRGPGLAGAAHIHWMTPDRAAVLDIDSLLEGIA